MIDQQSVERAAERFQLPEGSFERLELRRDRKQRNRRIRAGVLGIAIAVVVGWWGIHTITSTAPKPADPSEKFGIFAPVAGRIVFQDDQRGVLAVDPNGPVDTQNGVAVDPDVASTLVPLELDGTPLGWSSDGTELLLMRSTGDELFPKQYLSILHADGSETPVNKQPLGISDAAISPDGTRVVFVGEYDLVGLYVIDAEGGQPVQLPTPQAAGGANNPRFSPDGTQIAYLAGNGSAEVWLANADGTEAHQILADEPTALRAVTGFEWSPAGDRLAIGVGTHQQAAAPSTPLPPTARTSPG